MPRNFGHRRGWKRPAGWFRAAHEIGLEALTIYGFSTENWSRPAEEVSLLMGLLKSYFTAEISELHKAGIRIRVIGRKDDFSPDIKSLLDQAEAVTAANTGMTLCVALSYGGRQEIMDGVKALAAEVAAGTLQPEDISAGHLEGALESADLPSLDLIIRTSGEQRLSNFLLWQAAYTELYFDPGAQPATLRQNTFQRRCWHLPIESDASVALQARSARWKPPATAPAKATATASAPAPSPASSGRAMNNTPTQPPKTAGTDRLLIRFLTGIAATVFGLVVFGIGTPLVQLAGMAIAMVVAYEWSVIVRKSSRPSPPVAAMIIAVGATTGLTALGPVLPAALVLAGSLVACAALAYRSPVERFWLPLGIVYAAVPWSRSSHCSSWVGRGRGSFSSGCRW